MGMEDEGVVPGTARTAMRYLAPRFVAGKKEAAPEEGTRDGV